MSEFWVFLCPPGGNIEDARRGDILCPMFRVWAPTEERVREAYPYAVHVHRVS